MSEQVANCDAGAVLSTPFRQPLADAIVEREHTVIHRSHRQRSRGDHFCERCEIEDGVVRCVWRARLVGESTKRTAPERTTRPAHFYRGGRERAIENTIQKNFGGVFERLTHQPVEGARATARAPRCPSCR